MARSVLLRTLAVTALACINPGASAQTSEVEAEAEADVKKTNGLLAALAPDSVGAEVRYATAFETNSGYHSLSRLSITPDATWRLGRAWRAETSLRIELADDQTGLGSTQGYSNSSKPWIDEQHARVELDRAYLTWRSGSSRIRFGKQVTAWGVLDGVRITDRFDAVRRRDFLYTEVRPERIARWGLQTRVELGGFSLELSGAMDPTVSQQANLQDAFAPPASRFTGGLDIATLGGNEALPLRTSGRNAYGRDLTYGARTSRDVGAGRFSLLAFRGPTTDPVLEWAGGVPGGEIELRHPLRTLIGGSFDYTLGGSVVRAELAYIPDQPVNLQNGLNLTTGNEKRWLAGLGLDVDGPFGVFINAQLAVDHIEEQNSGATGQNIGVTLPLVRPQTDVIGTLRAQRRFAQAGWALQVEWLGSLTDGDGVARPQISREFTDKLSVSVGGDLAFGDREGLFGQFKSRNRAWLSLNLTL